MKVIYKHPLSHNVERQRISMSKGATILSVQFQPIDGDMKMSTLQLWALEDADSTEQEPRHLEVYSTCAGIVDLPLAGRDPEFQFRNRIYLGTAMTPNGRHVSHVFEVTK